MNLFSQLYDYLSFVSRRTNAVDLLTDRRTFMAEMLGLAALATTACSSSNGFPGKYPPMVSIPQASTPLVSKSQSTLRREVNIKEDFVASGHYCRWKTTRLKPTYITIHTTQNFSADALQHAAAVKNGRIRGGKIGYLSWHFTVDQSIAVQHLPLNEIGHHAEYGYGPGNMNSIGIEMCENRGNSPRLTYDRTAKLAACLMKEYNIPLKNVVGHYNWTGKDCPKPLLDHGRPGYKWAWFLSRVDYYYRCINGGSSNLA